MSFDPMVANDGRLRILASLASQGKQEFVDLRRATRLTDGNLASHARRLKTAGMIRIDKTLRNGKPVTRMDLTDQGRSALESHAKQLLAAMSLFSPLPG